MIPLTDNRIKKLYIIDYTKYACGGKGNAKIMPLSLEIDFFDNETTQKERESQLSKDFTVGKLIYMKYL